MLKPGTLLGGRYEIQNKIGQGGMSYVYRAQDKKLERIVAIKILKEEFAEDEAFIRKFKNEAQAAAGLSHPNIVGVYDVVDDGELHYIVMELVEGITLKNYIARKGHLSNKETIGIALQAAEGIGEAHKKGIIHRDIKPQNMIISRDGKVKVADFGIARAVSRETIHASVIGSVHYISPEQARSGHADARSDLYSLGISMYEMITGRVPYEGDNAVNVVMAHLQEAMVPPAVYNKDIYPALNEIILKACRKLPEERYQSAAELIADLRRCVREPDGHFVRYGKCAERAAEETAAGLKQKKADAAEGAQLREENSRAAEEDRPQDADMPEGADAKVQEDAGEGAERPPQDNGAAGAEQDRSEKLQRLMKYGSFAAGAIILAIILMIAASVTGFFRAFSPAESESRETEETRETSEAESESNYKISIQGEDLMPDLIGMPVAEAQAKLATMGISLDSSKTDFSDTYFEGLIIAQDPDADEAVIPGITVHATVSLGNKRSYTLEHLAGRTAADAEALLSDAGIEVADVLQEASETVGEGLVSGWQEASEEGNDSENGSIILIISSGKPAEAVRVPSVHNLSQAAASDTLKQAGLSVGAVSSQHSDIAAGLVIGQSPEANQSAAPGTPVSLVLSEGPAPTEEDAPEAAGPGGVQAASEEDADAGKYYYGSIDAIARAGTASGPNSSETVNIEIRLMQRGPKSFEYITLGELKAVPAGTEFPVTYPSIQGIYGVTSGEIQIVNSDTGETLETFSVSFAPRQ